MAKLKKPKLTKTIKSDFTKTNFFGIDFLTPEAKKAFIYQQKAFTKALILRHFDPKCYIQIETDTLGYAIDGILSQIILDPHFSDHVTYEDPNSSKSEIGQ